MSKSGFSQKDLRKIDNLEEALKKAIALDTLDAVVKSASKVLNVDSGKLSDKRNWSVKKRGKNFEINSGRQIPYANIQDNGGKIRITEKMRKFFWAMYAKTNQSKYKAMALTKNTHLTIKASNFSRVKVDPNKSTRVKRIVSKL